MVHLARITFVPIFIFLVALNPVYCQQDSIRTDSLNSPDQLPEKESVLSKEKKAGDNSIEYYNEAYYILRTEPVDYPEDINLETPQASLENFVINARRGNFGTASYSLNLRLLPENLSKEQIIQLSKKLFYVINQRVHLDWNMIPDRPDGQSAMASAANKAIAGKPRKSILFGTTALSEREGDFRLERVKSKNSPPIWLIAANTVENIEPLYAQYGPRKFDRLISEWSKSEILGLSVWKLVLVVLFVMISYFVFICSISIFSLISQKASAGWLKNAAKRLKHPASFALGVLTFYVTLNSSISFNASFARTLDILLLIAVVLAFTWLVTRILDTVMLHYAEQNLGDTSLEENEGARKMMTYISVGRRTITFLVLIIGLAVILSQFRSLQQLGISLLASAGVATVVLGLAAQSTLGNIVAGIQIAVTKPARIGDTVIINEEWGFVEDIGFTYMIVRTWDQRRLVIPLKKIISETFENWSMKDPRQIRPIDLYVDYTMDIESLRLKFTELLEGSDSWDEYHPPSVQVIDATERSVKVRALCSAKDSYSAWDLHCELREKLIKYIGSLDKGTYLTKSRLKFEGPTK